MKVLIVGFTKISYMPYLNFYIKQFEELKYDISLVCWDRDGVTEQEQSDMMTVLSFSDYMLDSEPLIKKIPHFIKFRRFTKGIIGNNKYDLILVLHTTPGVLLNDILTKEYAGRYILDYRDYTYENIWAYKRIINKLVNESLATFVSSRGYLKYLPPTNKVFISHNLTMHSSKEREIRKNLIRKVNPIKIRFWGFIRHVEVNQLLIDRLGNDRRFELHYHGRGQEPEEILREYVRDNQYKNVYFHGEYMPYERAEFARNTDLLHNIYENDIKTTFAMGNKYYDGLVFYLPQICNKGSFMGSEVKRYGIGVELDPNETNFADSVYEYYQSLDWNRFNNKCDEELSKIVWEYSEGTGVIKNLLSRKKEE